MTFEMLEVLVDYHYWARDRMLAALEGLSDDELKRPLGNSFSSVFDTVAHLCGADSVWRSRWEGVSPAVLPKAETYGDLAGVRTAWQEEERRIRGLLARLGPDGVAKPIAYQGPGGQHQAQPFWQMLQHLVNHGSYHRGQVTTMLRQLNATPPKSMDLIAFYRERAATPKRGA